MTQEEKDLLLKYLCMALPYGVKIEYVNIFCKIKQIVFEEHSTSYSFNDNNFSLSINDIQVWKPYLRPMSSMTEEEAKEIASLCLLDSRSILSIKITDEYLDVTIDDGVSSTETIILWYDELISSIECLYWLLEHHFDFMGLISKGLAIEVTEDNNPYKE